MAGSMELIIAGRFPTKGEADAVALALEPFVARADICIFHNNPPGQHDAYPIGGDEYRDPGAKLVSPEGTVDAPERRPAGIMLSVRIATPSNERRVIAGLRAGNAADIERAHGEWRDGDWTDFNPVEKPALVA
jgi:hypothetical protein